MFLRIMRQGVALFDMIMHDYDICSKITIKEIYIFAFDMLFEDLLGDRYGFQN